MKENINEEIEIDISELIKAIIKKLWIVILVTILGSVVAYLISVYAITAMYTSTTKIYVINRQNTQSTTTYTDLQTGVQLTKDYKVLVMSRTVMEDVIQNLELDISYESLVNLVTVNTPADTRIIEIEVMYKDPYMAKAIVDAIAHSSAEKMVSIMEMEKVNIVEEGNIASFSSSPKVLRNSVIGGFIGLLVTLVAITIIYLKDDSVKSADDIEKYIGITTLGMIPIEESLVKSKKVNRLLKKAHKKGYKGGRIKHAIN